MKKTNTLLPLLLLTASCVATPPHIENDNTPSSGKGSVSIAMVYGDNNQYNATTLWTRVEDNKASENVMLTGRRGFYDGFSGFFKALFNKGPITSEREVFELKPGTYALSHIALPQHNNSTIVSTGDGAWWKRNGWDTSKKEPVFLSFTVKADQNVKLPCIAIKDQLNTFQFQFDNKSNLITVGEKADVQIGKTDCEPFTYKH